jgi:hypothetical protein
MPFDCYFRSTKMVSLDNNVHQIDRERYLTTCALLLLLRRAIQAKNGLFLGDGSGEEFKSTESCYDSSTLEIA